MTGSARVLVNTDVVGDAATAKLHGSFHVRRFEDVLTLEEGVSPLTIDAYRRDIIRCAVFARDHGADSPAALTPTILREYVYSLKDLGFGGIFNSAQRVCASHVVSRDVG